MTKQAHCSPQPPQRIGCCAAPADCSNVVSESAGLEGWLIVLFLQHAARQVDLCSAVCDTRLAWAGGNRTARIVQSAPVQRSTSLAHMSVAGRCSRPSTAAAGILEPPLRMHRTVQQAAGSPRARCCQTGCC